jgi:hypothetical protein
MHHASEEFRRISAEFLSGKKETYATVLLGIVFKVYGSEAIEWDPATLESQLNEDFQVEIPDDVYDQLMAIINVMATDTVYFSVPVFDHTVSYLCRAGTHDVDAPSPHELAWACFEISINDPDPYDTGSDKPAFGDDIQKYCGVVLGDAGIRSKPMSLSFAQLPQWMPKDLSEDPTMSNAAQGSEQEGAADVDRFVEHHLGQMLEHLKELGIHPAPLLLARKADLPEADPLSGVLPA